MTTWVKKPGILRESERAFLTPQQINDIITRTTITDQRMVVVLTQWLRRLQLAPDELPNLTDEIVRVLTEGPAPSQKESVFTPPPELLGHRLLSRKISGHNLIRTLLSSSKILRTFAKREIVPSDADRPRRLTDEEIENIVQALPSMAGSEYIGRITPQDLELNPTLQARENLIAWTKMELKQKAVICPSAIPLLKTEIIRQHLRSRVAPGMGVGLTAAEAIGGTTTQMSLKTIHTTGSAKTMSTGVEGMKEILLARQERKKKNTTFFFKDDVMSYEDVLYMREEIVGTVVGDLVESADVGYAPGLEGLENLAFPKMWWHDIFPIVMGRNLHPSTYIMRLVLRVKEMYINGITLAMIANVIEGQLSVRVPSVMAVYNPLLSLTVRRRTKEGEITTDPDDQIIMDLYPDPNKIIRTLNEKKKKGKGKGASLNQTLQEIREQIYLKLLVAPELDILRIKGIAGIRSLDPVSLPVGSIIHEESPLDDNTLDLLMAGDLSEDEVTQLTEGRERCWQIIFNMANSLMTGVTSDNVVYLFEKAGIVTLRRSLSLGDNKALFAIMPPEAGSVRPQEYINKLKNDIEEDRRNKIEEARKKGEYLVVPPTDLENAYEFVFAIGQGNNLIEVLGNPMVDATRTYCNNMYDIARTLGIEATRNYMIKDLSDVIQGSGSYVNPRHIQLIADMNTFMGVPLGITYFGAAQQGIKFITLSTHERAMDVLTKAAALGDEESLRTSISGAIMTGQDIKLGTGYFDINTDPKYEAIWEDYKNRMDTVRQLTGEEAKFSVENIADALATLDKTITPATTSDIHLINIAAQSGAAMASYTVGERAAAVTTEHSLGAPTKKPPIQLPSLPPLRESIPYIRPNPVTSKLQDRGIASINRSIPLMEGPAVESSSGLVPYITMIPQSSLPRREEPDYGKVKPILNRFLEAPGLPDEITSIMDRVRPIRVIVPASLGPPGLPPAIPVSLPPLGDIDAAAKDMQKKEAQLRRDQEEGRVVTAPFDISRFIEFVQQYHPNKL